eukprot:5218685-Prymnesium_polylepis.1
MAVDTHCSGSDDRCGGCSDRHRGGRRDRDYCRAPCHQLRRGHATAADARRTQAFARDRRQLYVVMPVTRWVLEVQSVAWHDRLRVRPLEAVVAPTAAHVVAAADL